LPHRQLAVIATASHTARGASNKRLGMDGKQRYGAIEAGGTKFVCAVGSNADDLIATETFPTTTPMATLARAAEFFCAHIERDGPLAGIGIGSFGPLHLQRGSKLYGRIAATPKPGWAGADILGEIQNRVGQRQSDLRCVLDTDVNCALLGETMWGAGVGYRDLIYLTIGTGIGGGVMVDGHLVHGFAHPEVGHMFVPKLDEDAGFAGSCPFHGDRCIEGLAAGPALHKRWATAVDELPPNHACWTLQAKYLAMLCANLLLTTAPRRIILGGGVMSQLHLFALIREHLRSQLNGYIDFAENGIDLQSLIVPAALGARSGVAGCIALAQLHITSG
jgi:fructokinase